MASTNDFKKGMRLEIDGDPWQILDLSRQTPSARGASTLIKAKVKNIRSGQVLTRTWKSGETVNEADFEIRSAQYLYDDGGKNFTFMDSENYEQFELPRETIEEQLGYIRPNDEVRALIFEGACIGIDVAQTVTLTIVRCDPAVRGDTVNNVTKAAELETGLEIQVPLFVDEGTAVVIDTRDGRYIRRA